MRSEVEIEQILERLGNEWPSDTSLVDRVMQDLESQSIRPRSKIPGRPNRKSLLAFVASLAAVFVIWLTFRGSSSLYAQVIDGIRRASSFHMITTTHPAPNKPAQRVMQSWYVRDIGFREEVGSEVRLGNQNYLWTYVMGSNLAVRSQSRHLDEILDRMLNNETLQLLRQEQFDRYPAGDQNVDGQLARAYLLTRLRRAADPDLQSGRKRIVILLDNESRIVRARTEFRSEDDWRTQFTTEWKYDVRVDPLLFEPRFSEDVKIVDADTVFDEFVDLQEAVYREERSGLEYAIHRAERFQGGGILVVSSVRGTKETLKRYPLIPRRVRPGLFFWDGPATNYEASPRGDGYIRIELASADDHGINVSWWVLLPRGRQATRFDAGPGKVKIPVGITPNGAFADANFADEHGVIQNLTWDIVLDLPEPEAVPTLDQIARRVYADQVLLEFIPFKWLKMGSTNQVEQFRDPQKTSAEEFSNAVAERVRSWLETVR